MKIRGLQSTIKTPVFTAVQVQQNFPKESPLAINMQLARWVEKKYIVRLKRGLFLFPETQVDELALARLLYPQSYVSLETALHTQGILPDVTADITSITPTTSKRIRTLQGNFSYSKINSELYFGFSSHQDPTSQLFYHLAEPEKALLDLIYIRHIHSLEEYRLDLSLLSEDKLQLFAAEFLEWVRKVINEGPASSIFIYPGRAGKT